MDNETMTAENFDWVPPADLTERNAQYNSLPPASRRVAAAKDAIKRAESRQYAFDSKDYLLVPWVDGGMDAQGYLERGEKCTVCAVGGLLASRAVLGNELRLGDNGGLGRYVAGAVDTCKLYQDDVHRALAGTYSYDGWVFAKLPLQILQIKHKC